MHGDGVAYEGRRDVENKPSCMSCHEESLNATPEAEESHSIHGEVVSCSACHTATGYRQCADCHVGGGATASPAILLGNNPRNPSQLTTLRLIPTLRDTFKSRGIEQEKYDELPNFWDAVPHNIQKRTDRTRDCGTCHGEYAYFLEESHLPENGSLKNFELIR
jgi:hypothetical protein